MPQTDVSSGGASIGGATSAARARSESGTGTIMSTSNCAGGTRAGRGFDGIDDLATRRTEQDDGRQKEQRREDREGEGKADSELFAPTGVVQILVADSRRGPDVAANVGLYPENVQIERQDRREGIGYANGARGSRRFLLKFNDLRDWHGS